MTPSSLPTADELIPPGLTDCATAPKVPARPAPDQPRTDAAKTGYLIGLDDAYRDCKGTVGATKAQHDKLAKQFPNTPKKGFSLGPFHF